MFIRIRNWLLISYSAILLLWYLAWRVFADSFWWATLINRIAFHFFQPLPIMLGLALIPPRRTALLWLLPGILVITLVSAPLQFPHPAAIGNQPALRVMSFNILFSNTDSAGLIRTIQAANPDLIAMQEVQPAMFEKLRSGLSNYPYAIMSSEHPYGTTAIFSKIAFDSSKILELQADRRAVWVQLHYQGQPIEFVSAHLLAYGLEWVTLPEIPQTVVKRVTEQERQVHRIIEATSSDPNTLVIVACDCNSVETAGSARIFYRQFQSSAHVAGWAWEAFSAPGAEPDLALNHIDYIFFRGPRTATSHYRLRDQGGSDHQPILAVFR